MVRPLIIMFLHKFQTTFVRQKTPHPKELKAKAHKLFGVKKGDQVQQNEDPQNALHEGNEDAPHGNEKQNGVAPSAVFFRDGVETQQAASNGHDYQDDGGIGDDENEEVSLLYMFS